MMSASPTWAASTRAGAFEEEPLAVVTTLFALLAYLRASRSGFRSDLLATVLLQLATALASPHYRLLPAIAALHLLILPSHGRECCVHAVSLAFPALAGAAGILALALPANRHHPTLPALLSLLPLLSFVPALFPTFRPARLAALFAFPAWMALDLGPAVLSPFWDRRAAPVVFSVADAQPASWADWWMNLHAMLLILPAGIRLSIQVSCGPPCSMC
jgi:hypothetical protein